MIRFRAGGGRPPSSHEVLLVDSGDAWYLTGMPWPQQPPFDEIGAYRADLGAGRAGRLEELARAAAAEGQVPLDDPDLGSERVRVGNAQARWSPDARRPAQEAFVAAAREAIAELRARPWSAARGRLHDESIELVNTGEHPLALAGAEVHVGYGRPDRPPSPLRLVVETATALDLPASLEPGATAAAGRPPAGAPLDDQPAFDAVYALVHLPFRSPVDDEGRDGWIDGWLVCGPAA